MLCFYPRSTVNIWHKGQQDNLYRLDGIDKHIRLADRLKKQKDCQVIEISSAGREKEAARIINAVHSPAILRAYRTGHPAALASSSGIMWQPSVYPYALEQALGCRYAVDAALTDKLSLTLLGAGEESEHAKPYGFNLINSLAISALYAAQVKHARVAVVDLDVHYCNGVFDILRHRPNIFSAVIWNKKLPKWKYFKSGGNIWHRRVETVDRYFTALQELSRQILSFQPTLILYLLGLDVLQTDRLGGIKGFRLVDLYKREKLVGNLFTKTGASLVIFLGGAYVDYSQKSSTVLKQKNQITQTHFKLLKLYQSHPVSPL